MRINTTQFNNGNSRVNVSDGSQKTNLAFGQVFLDLKDFKKFENKHLLRSLVFASLKIEKWAMKWDEFFDVHITPAVAKKPNYLPLEFEISKIPDVEIIELKLVRKFPKGIRGMFSRAFTFGPKSVKEPFYDNNLIVDSDYIKSLGFAKSRLSNDF